MPFDGIFMSNICRELSCAIGSRIEKIHQPSRDEIVISLGGKNFNNKLYISAGGVAPRVHFTRLTFENPSTPPMFCMLMRKYFNGAKLTEIFQHGLDRILTLKFSSYNELGDSVELEIVAEIMGRQSNVILICNGKIVDALKRTDIQSSKRMILPGAVYEYPESQDKIDIRKSCDVTEINAIASQRKGSYASVLEGVSPLIGREIEHLSLYSTDQKAFDMVLNGAECGLPYMLINNNGEPTDYTYMPILQYGSTVNNIKCDSFSDMLDAFYEKRQKQDDIRRRTHDICKLTDMLIERTSRRIEKQRGDLSRCTNPDELRIFGELIKANIQTIERGAAVVELPNYYDPEYNNVRIKLNPEYTPSQNAQKYFKDYKKAITAGETLKKLIKSGEDELEYLLSVSEELKRAETDKELAEIKLELEESGYIKVKHKQKKQPKSLPPLKFKSDDGFIIRVGRNNKQNDELTLKLSEKLDVWMHTKSVHGAHVIISANGQTPPDITLMQAAKLAAYYSNARQSSSVAVDYCIVKNVRKPSGAKPGMVIYDNHNTLYVTPDEDTVQKLKSIDW